MALILALVATAVASLLPIYSHAAVDWSEGFEYADDTAMRAKWPSSCLGNPGVSTLRPFSGPKSLRLVYRGAVGVDPGAGGCFIDRSLSSLSTTLYTRLYMYMENFTVNSTTTKIAFNGPYSGYPSFWWGMLFGQPGLSVTVQGIILDNGSSGSQNVSGGTIPQNQWVCLETRLTMSTPGVDNGIVQAWINGTQVINKTNQRMRAAAQTGTNSPNAQFKLVKLYTQNGRGVIYYDDYAVSRDAKIGCSGSTPASDTTPPTPPSGMLVR